ncbi:hypothetical protein TNCV_4689981 [Trichonephila clavipes]|nr:hypothetical protein TNCV_4689981 [Trichonephila clavipes]
MNGIDVLKRTEEPSNTMNVLEDLRRHRTCKMLRSNVFEKIVTKTLNTFLRLHTSQRRRLRESIRRKRPQFWLSDDWYILHDNVPAHRSQLKYLYGGRFVSSGEVKVAGGLTRGCEKWLPALLLEVKRTLAEVYRHPTELL